MCIGTAQLTTAENRASVRQARSLGIGTALTLGAVDLVYAPRRRITRMYLVDAALEAGWVLAWASVPPTTLPTLSVGLLGRS